VSSFGLIGIHGKIKTEKFSSGLVILNCCNTRLQSTGYYAPLTLTLPPQAAGEGIKEISYLNATWYKPGF
jgi:hypothetical protein